MRKRHDDDWQLIIATVIFYILLALMVLVAIIVREVNAKATDDRGGEKAELYIYSERFTVESVVDEVEPEEIVGPVQRFERTVETINAKMIEEPVVEVEVEAAPVIEPVMEESVAYYDVPLEEALQGHIFALCEEYDIDPSIIIAMIKKESTFDSGAVGDNGNSKGLMQIQQRFHQERMDRLGCTDLLDPYQNVAVGIDLLAELIDMDRGLEWALMCYNGGYAYANKKVSEGVLSAYAETVLATSKELQKVA